MSRFFRSACLIALLHALVSCACRADEVLLHDGTFNDADWSQVPSGGHGDATASQMLSGGNPGEYRYVRISGGVFGQYFAYESFNFYQHAYDPATQGAIISIDFSEDSTVFSNTGVNAPLLGVALEQDGYWYDGPAFEDTNYFWAPSTKLTGLETTDFNGPRSAIIGGQPMHPDFSVVGHPILFGFSVFEQSAPNSFECESGVDNWEVTLHVVPEPATFQVLGVLLLVATLQRHGKVRPTGSDVRHFPELRGGFKGGI